MGKSMGRNEKLITVEQYAKHRRVSRQTVYKNINRGQISDGLVMVDGKRKINPGVADRELTESLDRVYNPGDKKKPSPPEMEHAAEKAGTKGMSMADAQKLQAQYKAALLKLEYEQKSGKLIDASVVEVDTFNFARRVRDAIQNVPDRIAAELASCTDVHQVREKLNASYNEALEELSK